MTIKLSVRDGISVLHVNTLYLQTFSEASVTKVYNFSTGGTNGNYFPVEEYSMSPSQTGRQLLLANPNILEETLAMEWSPPLDRQGILTLGLDSNSSGTFTYKGWSEKTWSQLFGIDESAVVTKVRFLQWDHRWRGTTSWNFTNQFKMYYNDPSDSSRIGGKNLYDPYYSYTTTTDISPPQRVSWQESNGYVTIPSGYQEGSTSLDFVFECVIYRPSSLSSSPEFHIDNLYVEATYDTISNVNILPVDDSTITHHADTIYEFYIPPIQAVISGEDSVITLTSHNNVLNDIVVLKTQTTSFATTAENWQVSSSAWAFSSTEGNPAGSEVFSITGRNAVGTSNLFLTRTWEQLGITPGTTVSEIRLESLEYKVTGYTTVDYLRLFPLQVRYSNDTLIGTLQAQIAGTAIDTVYNSIEPSSYIAIPTDLQESTSTVKLNIYAEGDTGNNKDAAARVAVDNIVFKIKEKTKLVKLRIKDGIHAHTSERVVLVYTPEETDVTLVVQQTSHTLTSDNVSLTQHNVLVVNDSLNTLSSDNVLLSLHFYLTSNDSTHSLTSDNVVLAYTPPAILLVLQKSSHSITSDNLTLVVKYILTINDSFNTVSSDNAILVVKYLLVVSDSLNTASSDNANLTVKYLLSVEDSVNSLTSDNITLSSSYNLIVADSVVSVSSDNVEISSNYLLTVDSSNHTLISDQADLIQHNSLITQSSLHTLISDYVNLEAVVVLIINSSDHIITSDNAEITSKYLLILDDTLHILSSENVQLESNYILIVESSVHSLSETVINLNSNYVLTVNNSSHITDSNNINLDSNYVLSVESSTHNIISDNIGLVSYYNLIVEDSSHSQASDTIDISVFYDIIVQDSSHSVLSDNLALIQHYVLVIDSTNHEVVSDEVNLSGSYLLVISDSTHNITSTNLTLQLSSLNLIVEDSNHTLISDNLNLTTYYVLSIDACNHDLLSDNVVLESSYVLTLEDSLITVTSENVTLTQFIQLNVENSLHTLNSEEPTLQSKYIIVIDNCNHSVISETITISHKYTFVVNDTNHSVSSEVPSLSSHYILSLVFFGHHTITSDTANISSFSLGSGETYKLKVKFTGNNIVVDIDGINKFIFDEASFNNTQTKFGIKSIENNVTAKNKLDNFKVSK